MLQTKRIVFKPSENGPRALKSYIPTSEEIIKKKDEQIAETIHALKNPLAVIKASVVLAKMKIVKEKMQIKKEEVMSQLKYIEGEIDNITELIEKNIRVLKHFEKNTLLFLEKAVHGLSKSLFLLKEHLTNEGRISFVVKRLDELIRELKKEEDSETILFNPKFHNLNLILEKEVRSIRSICEMQKVDLSAQYGKLPFVSFDLNLMKMLIENMLMNAINATQKSTDKKIIGVNTSTNCGIVLDIWNTGPEIPEHIWKQFETGSGFVKDKEGRIRWGFYTIIQIAKLHNAEVIIETNENKTSFQFTFPLNEFYLRS